MSQRAVERVLGRLVTDASFRAAFFRKAPDALLTHAADLTPDELDALRRVPPEALVALESRLDDRICRLCVPTAATDEGKNR
jgi:hypothetical protein